MNKLERIVHDDSNGLDYILVGEIYLPLIAVPEEKREIGFYGSLHRNKTILLAEDNELNAEIAMTILQDAHARVEVASDGAILTLTSVIFSFFLIYKSA